MDRVDDARVDRRRLGGIESHRPAGGGGHLLRHRLRSGLLGHRRPAPLHLRVHGVEHVGHGGRDHGGPLGDQLRRLRCGWSNCRHVVFVIEFPILQRARLVALRPSHGAVPRLGGARIPVPPVAARLRPAGGLRLAGLWGRRPPPAGTLHLQRAGLLPIVSRASDGRPGGTVGGHAAASGGGATGREDGTGAVDEAREDDTLSMTQSASVARRSAASGERRAKRAPVLGGRPFQLPPPCASCNGYTAHAGVVIGAAWPSMRVSSGRHTPGGRAGARGRGRRR